MRRSDRARDRSFAFDVIDRCGHGVAALSTGGEGPYCIPLSLVRVGDDLFFHCALEGRKLDLLRRDPRVCVTFVAADQPAYLPESNMSPPSSRAPWSPAPPLRSQTPARRPLPCGPCVKR